MAIVAPGASCRLEFRRPAYGSCRTCGKRHRPAFPTSPWTAHRPRRPQAPQAFILDVIEEEIRTGERQTMRRRMAPDQPITTGPLRAKLDKRDTARQADAPHASRNRPHYDVGRDPAAGGETGGDEEVRDVGFMRDKHLAHQT